MKRSSIGCSNGRRRNCESSSSSSSLPGEDEDEDGDENGPGLMNLSIEHIGLAANDTAALKDWYVRVLGAREVFGDGKSPPAFMLQLSGGMWIEIYPAETSTPATGNNRLAGWRHLAIRVDSIEAAREELASRGVVFEEPIKPAGGGGRVLFLKDLEGNLLHLAERPENPTFRSRNL